jgi:hypothetical protein
MGLWFGIAFSVLALVIILGAQVRGSLPPAGVVEVLRTLGAITLSYLFGFYGAGAVYDMLLPIGHRFIGYVLRWGLGGAIVYGAIAVMMSLMESSDPMSWRGTLSFALGMGVLWSVIGAGIWVKDRVNGKLPKPVV